MKIHLINEQKGFYRQVIKEQMSPGGVLRSAPIDERKLFMKAAEIDINYNCTLEGGQKSVRNLVKKSRRHGIPKGVIKDRPGLKYNPEIKHFLKNVELLKKSLINYLGAK